MELTDKEKDIFYIPARKCKRCGGILTSSKAIKDGYGCVCKRKEREERNRYLPGQTTLFDMDENPEFDEPSTSR